MLEKIPLISVLICNYNYGRFIREALESAIQQDYANIEIVVIDDGSSDNSVEVVRAIIAENPSKKIRLNAKKKNQGICYARNDAIDAANGLFFLFLDSDDTIPQSYLSDLYKVAISRRADVVYTDVKTFGATNSVSNYPDYDQKDLLLHNYINVSALVNKQHVGSHRFDVTLNRKTLEDYDFWIGLSLKGLSFVKAPGAYLNYRIQNQSRNDNAPDIRTQHLKFIDIWEYIITKYQMTYPKIIPRDIFVRETKFQIEEIGGELSNLNKIVQSELIPELEKRAQHMEQQQRYIEELEARLIATHESVSYRTGRAMTAPMRTLKKAVKRHLR